MSSNYKPWMKSVAKAGLVSKGIVYFTFGALVLIATYSVSENPVGLFEIVRYIIDKGWFGRVLVLIMALGLLCYSAWKFLQMAYNAEGYKNDLAGYFIRITWIGPFIFYLVLGGHALIQLYKWYFSTFVYFDGKSSEFQEMLQTSWGEILIIAISLTLMVNAITLFYLAYTGKFKLLMSGRTFYENSPRIATTTGFIGYIGYGITLFIVAGLFALAIYYSDYSLARGQVSMFYYLQSKPFGKIALTLVAIGTIAYGLYFFLASFYRWRKPVG